MKKIILSLILVLSSCVFISCDTDEYTYTLTYEIYWNSNNVDRKTVVCTYPISIESYKGTNKIYTYEYGFVESTTAPIKKISYTKKKK